MPNPILGSPFTNMTRGYSGPWLWRPPPDYVLISVTGPVVLYLMYWNWNEFVTIPNLKIT